MSAQSERSRLSQRVIAELGRWRVAPGVDASLFEAFVRDVLGRLRGPFLAQLAAREVLTELEAAFVFVRTRRPGEVRAELRAVADAHEVRALTHMDDQPFIVDTLRLFLRRAGAEPLRGFNVVVRCVRDADGVLVGLGGAASQPESLALFLGEASVPLVDVEAATARLTHALQLAQAAVRDFRPMRRAVEHIVTACESWVDAHPDQALRYAEAAAFLKWLCQENFVFLGAVTAEGGLGIDSVDGPFRGDPEGAWPARTQGGVWFRRSDLRSPVHREGRLEEIRVVLDPGGPLAEALYVRGMYTYRGVSQPTRNVPIVRDVLRAELTAQEAVPGSYRYKAMANAFDSLPTEIVFTSTREQVATMIEAVLDTESSGAVAASVQPRDDGSVFALVTLPKVGYSDDLRRDLQALVVAALDVPEVDHGVFLGRFDTVVLHFYAGHIGPRAAGGYDVLEGQLRDTAQPWQVRLWDVVAAAHGEDRADAILQRYGTAFPEDWTLRTSPARAARDIELIELLSADEPVLADLFEDDTRPDGTPGYVILRVYQNSNVYLTQLVPVLDDFGLVVIRSEAVRVTVRDADIEFDSFTLSAKGADREALLRNRDVLLDAIPAVFNGRIESDRLNGLVVSAGLDWSAVDVLRAYTRYMRQLGVNVTAQRLHTVMLAWPDVARRLYDLFRARFDPGLDARRSERIAVALDALDERLRRVRSHDEDLVLGGVLNLLQATLRTNAFRADRVSHYLSFKLDCARVRDMRGQRPLYEIYVHSRAVEGVHLRFGRVARGGLRWSDRADYRTEVLGLVTTQQIKNVVIVPEGSKGGFFVREPHRDGAERRKQADKLYEVFIRGLLDLTDNVVDGATVPPPRVVAADEADPYLVVAADKGTAHLSDTANRLSLSYGFWLGDAFASGGSNGYDHKKVGITARGGWVVVKRLFAELGKDPDSQPITVVGIGDMGGDVFGNGLLESRHLRLVAAFNHVHVFLDPTPDAERAFAERERLFHAGGRDGGWDRYDASTLSPGGGVYERAAKAVPLSPEAATLLGLTAGDVPPEDVIRAILRLDADLLWSGGIGTYVKASFESDDDADDRGNDRFRVDASELRVAVVGEGANLSFTQAARIEAATRGVRIDADFIDNSAGVDLSDHEVNLKILVRGPEQRGELDGPARNALLASLTDEVADLVLADNAIQALQLSRDEVRARADVYPFARAIAFVERYFQTPRATWTLPSDEEIARRARDGTGLTRPELATLSAHVKRFVKAELFAHGRDAGLLGVEDALQRYFPADIRRRFPADVVGHQLAHQIAMTVITTRVVGDAGAAFVPVAVDFTGRSVVDVIDAWLRAAALVRLDDVRPVLEAFGPPALLRARYAAGIAIDASCRAVATQWLAAGGALPAGGALDVLRGVVDAVDGLVGDGDETLRGESFEEADPAVVACVRRARHVSTALLVRQRMGGDATDGDTLRTAVALQLAAGRATRLQEVADELRRRPAVGAWEPVALQQLAERFQALLQLAVAGAPTPSVVDVDALTAELTAGPLAGVRATVDGILGAAPAETAPDLATLVVLEARVTSALAKLGGASS